MLKLKQAIPVYGKWCQWYGDNTEFQKYRRMSETMIVLGLFIDLWFWLIYEIVTIMGIQEGRRGLLRIWPCTPTLCELLNEASCSIDKAHTYHIL